MRQDLAYIKLGQEATVTLDYLPDREFRGRVTYIYPSVDEKTRTAQVRMEFHNPGYFLKPGMFAFVRAACGIGAVRPARAGHGRPAQRRENDGLCGPGGREIRAAHRDARPAGRE